MTCMLEITYEEDVYNFSELDKTCLSFIENLLKENQIFQLQVNHSFQIIIEELQKLCKTLNIKLDITENSEPEAVFEVIKVLGGVTTGVLQGGLFGFLFARVLEEINNKMGGGQALEVFIESLIGIDIFIPGMGQIMMLSSVINALINGVVAHSTLKNVKVHVHFQKPTNNNYKGLVFNSN